MGCCGKIKKAIKNRGPIIRGFTSLAVEKATGIEVMKSKNFHSRIRICQKCDRKDPAKWAKKSLWCLECGCYVPAKARVEKEVCPLGKWAIRPEKATIGANHFYL